MSSRAVLHHDGHIGSRNTPDAPASAAAQAVVTAVAAGLAWATRFGAMRQGMIIARRVLGGSRRP